MSIICNSYNRHFQIPKYCCISLGCIGIVYSFISEINTIDCVLGIISISLPLFGLYLVTHQSAIGGGDIKLMAASGILLGWKKNLLAFFLSGLCVVFHCMFTSAFINKNEKIAFGPYIAIGILLSFTFGDTIIDWYIQWPGIL